MQNSIIYHKINGKKTKYKHNNDDFSFELKEQDGHYIGTIKVLDDIVLDKVNLVYKYDYDFDDYLFLNGYQSWTDTKEFRIYEHLKNIYKAPRNIVNKYSFDKYGDATFKKYKKHVLHAFDYSYIRGKKPIFIVSNNYNNSYLVINHCPLKNKIILESDVKGLLLKRNQEFIAFDFILKNEIKNSLNNYFNKYNNSKQNIFGYTSWYNHYQNINEEIIYSNLNSINHQFNLFQIDDGYEEFVGDWLRIDINKFPNGLNEICNKIKEKDLISGIWLAPFIAEEKSNLFINHKEYFKKDKKGNYIKAGSNWSGFYVLDIYNEEVVEYIRRCLIFYKDMGFKFFKLDFLYAIGLCEYEGKTRANVISYGYSLLRSILKDDIILGCGAIISNSIDNFDYLRVGPDVSLKFDDVWFMKLFHRERISTKVTIQNTIFRSIFNNKLFGNDPDVFLLRNDNIGLSKKQRTALALINVLFGDVIMTSDDINKYNNETKELLDKLLYIANNKKNVKYEMIKKNIEISYMLNDKEYKLTYNTKKGIFINGQDKLNL